MLPPAPAAGGPAVTHVLLVHDPAAAETLRAAVAGAGYGVRLDTHDGGWTWIVYVVAPAAARDWCAALAAAHGAEYEGAAEGQV